MDKEKLEKAADLHLELVGSESSSYHSFCDGAEWLIAQPIRKKLTNKEKEDIRCLYNACKYDNSSHSSDPENTYNRVRRLQLLEDLFGKELFE